MERRSFLIGMGALFAAPAVVRADRLMKVTGERFAQSCFGESDMILSMLNKAGAWRGLPVSQAEGLITGMSRALLAVPCEQARPGYVRQLEFIASPRGAAALNVEYDNMRAVKWIDAYAGGQAKTRFRGIPVRLDA